MNSNNLMLVTNMNKLSSTETYLSSFWRNNNRMILGLIESDQVFWLFGKPFVRCGRFDWIGKNILWKAQKTYSEINVLSEKKTKTNIKSEIESSKWLIQGLASPWTGSWPEVNRKLITGNDNKVIKDQKKMILIGWILSKSLVSV